MNTFTVWISRASGPDQFFQVDNDILSFSGLDWGESMNLAREDQEAGGEDAEEEKC